MSIKLRCPKCRGQDLSVEQFQVESILFTIENGKRTGSFLNNGGMSEVLHIDANCDSCGHKWRVRSVNDWDEEVEPKGQP